MNVDEALKVIGDYESVVVRITPPSLASPAERAEVPRRVMAQESA